MTWLNIEMKLNGWMMNTSITLFFLLLGSSIMNKNHVKIFYNILVYIYPCDNFLKILSQWAFGRDECQHVADTTKTQFVASGFRIGILWYWLKDILHVLNFQYQNQMSKPSLFHIFSFLFLLYIIFLSS